MKPPNILVKTNCQQTYLSWHKKLKAVLQPETYITYQIVDENFCKQPWLQSCALLVYASPVVSSATEVLLKRYLNAYSGKILFHSVDGLFNSSVLNELKLKSDGINVSESYQNENLEITAAIIGKELSAISQHQLLSILKDLGINVEENIANLCVDNQGYLFSSNPAITVSDIFKISPKDQDTSGAIKVSGRDIKLNFTEKKNEQPVKLDEHNIFNIQTSYQQDDCKFDWKLYESGRKTKYLGKQLIYTDVISSTQDIFTKLNVNIINVNGLVITARQQTKGKGRSGNQWLSPVGCMMFSTQIDIQLHSNLASKLPFIQHIAVVAFVKAIKDRHGYDKLDLNIKWPNDIYICKNTKIGGVIVNSSLWKDTFKVIIGLGVNVSNEKPTECLNSLINEYNEVNHTELGELIIEDVLASTLNQMEHLISMFQINGAERFKEEYYKYWMHSDTEVTLECRDNEKARIIGLDEFGYLLVQLNSGTKLSLQPDGNSFDMMRNMITQKN